MDDDDLTDLDVPSLVAADAAKDDNDGDEADERIPCEFFWPS